MHNHVHIHTQTIHMHERTNTHTYVHTRAHNLNINDFRFPESYVNCDGISEEFSYEHIADVGLFSMFYVRVFEAIMTKRLISWAENTDQLPTKQSGFRKHHSTNDKLFELTKAVCQAQRLSTRVGAVFLDIEKAFDRVWHNGLRYT